MTRRLLLHSLFLCLIATGSFAADRVWQTGTWTEIRTTRPRFVFRLQPSPNGPGPHTTTPTLVRTYVVETDTVRFELAEIKPASQRTIDAIVGETVTFAVERKTFYVRERPGIEHRLRITKRRAKLRDE